MATYLVTGGCGFIGSHLCEALVAGGHQVRVLDDLSTGSVDNLPARVDFVHGDIVDPDVVNSSLQAVSGCFHLAAVASVERSVNDWLGSHYTNLSGTIAILECARKM